MAEVIRQRLNDSPIARWTVLFIVATAMMMGYFVNDVMSPLEALLEMPKAEGGLGWTSSDYGFFSGSGSFINVFLLQRIPADALLLGTDSRQDGHSFYRRIGLFVDGAWYAAEILRRHD